MNLLVQSAMNVNQLGTSHHREPIIWNLTSLRTNHLEPHITENQSFGSFKTSAFNATRRSVTIIYTVNQVTSILWWILFMIAKQTPLAPFGTFPEGIDHCSKRVYSIHHLDQTATLFTASPITSTIKKCWWEIRQSLFQDEVRNRAK